MIYNVEPIIYFWISVSSCSVIILFIGSTTYIFSRGRGLHQNVSVVQKSAESASLILLDWIEINLLMPIDNLCRKAKA
jgi:hypothetical protein